MATAAQPRGRPFAAGVSGNAKGRPKGSRSRASVVIDRIAEADASEILKMILAMAKTGDLTAALWVASRIIPPARDRAIRVAIPATDSLAGIEQAHDVVLDAVSAGSITLAEATSLASLIEGRRRTFEVGELERRIAEIETHNLRQKP